MLLTMVSTGANLVVGTGLVCLNQKEQVHEDMQTITRTTTVERMLESVDHLIEKHRGNSAIRDHLTETPHMPKGWVLYSASYAAVGRRKGWRVELLDTTKPFQTGSIVEAWHSQALDGALREASHKVLASRRETAA